jgi:amino-acid N-acetyltransferase
VGIWGGLQTLGAGAQGRRDGIAALNFGAMVLLSPLAFHPPGSLQPGMEEVATSVAIALQTDKLIFLTETPVCASTDQPESEDNRLTPGCPWPLPSCCY